MSFSSLHTVAGCLHPIEVSGNHIFLTYKMIQFKNVKRGSIFTQV